MSKTNVRGYTDKELLDKVKSLDNYSHTPEGYWILGVQSQEDQFNSFDDKFYIFKGEEFIMVTPGTTNSGQYGLFHFNKYGQRGTFTIKTDHWFYDLWKYGYHRGKMPALVQNTPIIGYRDNNKNKKTEEIGEQVKGYFGINFHTVTYNLRKGFWRKSIDSWATGCQVVNHVTDYLKIIDMVKKQKTVTYCIIKEFE